MGHWGLMHDKKFHLHLSIRVKIHTTISSSSSSAFCHSPFSSSQLSALQLTFQTRCSPIHFSLLPSSIFPSLKPRKQSWDYTYSLAMEIAQPKHILPPNSLTWVTAKSFPLALGSARIISMAPPLSTASNPALSSYPKSLPQHPWITSS